jgi:hypothetical protein
MFCSVVFPDATVDRGPNASVPPPYPSTGMKGRSAVAVRTLVHPVMKLNRFLSALTFRVSLVRLNALSAGRAGIDCRPRIASSPHRP